MVKKRCKDAITNIMLIVVSVLLVYVVTSSFTMAWFAGTDEGSTMFAFGGAVVVEVANQHGALSDGEPVEMDYSADYLLPGMRVIPFVYTMLKQSSTTAIMRARIDTSVTGLTPEQNEQLNIWFRTAFSSQIDQAWALNATDGWYYFLGSNNSGTMVMTQTASSSGLTTPVYGTTYANYIPATNRTITNQNTVLGSVYPGAGNTILPFLTKDFRIPFHITEEFANATINLTFYVEALQDYLINTETEENILPTLQNAKTIFDSITKTHDSSGNLIV